MGLLDRISQRTKKVIKGLEHLTYEGMLKDLGVFSPEKGRPRGAL